MRHVLLMYCIPLALTLGLFSHGYAADCSSAVARLPNAVVSQLDTQQLTQVLGSLNQSARLPDGFVTKQHARAAGWQPGTPLWKMAALKGKSIGGDRFGNFERRLPRGEWREADLNYRGSKRGAQRLVFEPRRDGRRFVTVDHYETFNEVPSCR
jgi:ribonuclease T1